MRCNTLIILFSIVVLLTACQCKEVIKLPKELPPITQEGKNTFGFKADGELWTPYAACSIYGNPCAELSCSIANIPPSARMVAPMGMAARRKFLDVDSHISIDARGRPFTRLGSYIDSISVQFRSNGIYSLGYPQQGDKFNITRIDTINRIVSGEFEFTLKDTYGGGTTIRITEGRFDFKYPFCKCSN